MSGDPTSSHCQPITTQPAQHLCVTYQNQCSVFCNPNFDGYAIPLRKGHAMQHIAIFTQDSLGPLTVYSLKAYQMSMLCTLLLVTS